MRERERIIISQSHGALETENQTGVDFETNLIEVIGCMVDQGHAWATMQRSTLHPSCTHITNLLFLLCLSKSTTARHLIQNPRLIRLALFPLVMNAARINRVHPKVTPWPLLCRVLQIPSLSRSTTASLSTLLAG